MAEIKVIGTGVKTADTDTTPIARQVKLSDFYDVHEMIGKYVLLTYC